MTIGEAVQSVDLTSRQNLNVSGETAPAADLEHGPCCFYFAGDTSIVQPPRTFHYPVYCTIFRQAVTHDRPHVISTAGSRNELEVMGCISGHELQDPEKEGVGYTKRNAVQAPELENPLSVAANYSSSAVSKVR